MRDKSPSNRPTPDFKKIFHLAEHYADASKILAEQAKGKDWGSSAPKLLVDSFAVELYLKCLYVMDKKATPPNEHDWLTLFDALEPNTKLGIREIFDQNIKSDPVLSNLTVFNPDALIFIDFNRSLEAAKNTFHNRRYLYEENIPKSEWFYADLLTAAFRGYAKMVIPFGGQKTSD